MGPVPQIADYQTAAKNIYEPQKQAEATQLAATRDTTKNTLEAEKGQIGTDYQSALNNLKDALTQQSGQIQQVYNQRLMGNISGLQGNDMGQMFARANQQEATIEQTRANKLASITAAEGNADINYNAGMAALTPRYLAEEEKYAEDGYGGAMKNYTDNYFKQANLALREQATNQSAYDKAQSAAAADAAKYGSKQGSEGQYFFHGPNGEPVSLGQYLDGVSQGDGKIWTNHALNILKNGTAYDKAIYNKAVQAYKSHGDVAATIAKYDTKNAYGLMSM